MSRTSDEATELEIIKARLETLEGAETARRTRNARLRRLTLVAAGLLSLLYGGAWAADGNCPNGFPFCFTSDTPANASEVNHNFSQLKQWVEQKVGTVNSADVALTGTTTVSGPATFSGTSTFNGALNAGTVSAATLNGTTVNASALNAGGDLSAPNNSWGSNTRSATFNRSACGVESGATCPPGRYVCGIYANHVCGNNWPEINWSINCCSL